MNEIVIFDLDGTLLDTILDLKEALNYSLNELGYPGISLTEVRKNIGDGLYNLIKRSIHDNVNDDIINKGKELFTSYYQEHINVYTRVFDGIIELLLALKDKNIKIGVLSNKDDYAVKFLCDKYFNGLIDVAQGFKNGSKVKPDPTSVLEVKNSLGNGKTYYVGDSDTDALTAINAALTGVLVSWGYEDIETLNSFNMPIINKPLELLKILKQRN